VILPAEMMKGFLDGDEELVLQNLEKQAGVR
jgi:hypothetical protein